MNWQKILERIETVDRQRLTSICHLAGCWHNCSSALFEIKRGGLGEPADEQLYTLELKFHQTLTKLLALWEELHFSHRAENFNREKIRAVNLLNKIQSYKPQ